MSTTTLLFIILVAALMHGDKHFCAVATDLRNTNNLNNLRINIRTTPMPPEYVKELGKLNATEAKVRAKIQLQESDLEVQKTTLTKYKEQVRTQETTVAQVEEWLKKAQASIGRIERAKQAVEVKFDLQRLRPFVNLAKQKREKLLAQSEKIGSAHKEVSDRVESLENQLRELQSNVLDSEKKHLETTGTGTENEKMKTKDAAIGPSSPSSSSESTASTASSTDLKAVEGTLDDLMKELG
jgi:chromosome segregation ATPase